MAHGGGMECVDVETAASSSSSEGDTSGQKAAATLLRAARGLLG